jgi:ubiquinone/menaquinone biosynthesis C-methylase UbiE
MGFAGRLFAASYDTLGRGVEAAGLAARRESLLSRAGGDVLEIGAGTGLNLPYYGSDVASLTFAEPAEPMARRLERRLRDRAHPAAVVRAPAAELPFEDSRFDVAVSTLVLCTVPDQARALAEVRRVLKPGGQLFFIEHVRSHDPRRAVWQDRLNGLNRLLGHGCNCNRETVEEICAAGFSITDVAHGELARAPTIVRPLAVGVARLST